MTGATRQVQVSTAELSDAERRRRLAAVYRRLIKLGQRNNSPDIPSDAGASEPNSLDSAGRVAMSAKVEQGKGPSPYGSRICRGAINPTHPSRTNVL